MTTRLYSSPRSPRLPFTHRRSPTRSLLRCRVERLAPLLRLQRARGPAQLAGGPLVAGGLVVLQRLALGGDDVSLVRLGPLVGVRGLDARASLRGGAGLGGLRSEWRVEGGGRVSFRRGSSESFERAGREWNVYCTGRSGITRRAPSSPPWPPPPPPRPPRARRACYPSRRYPPVSSRGTAAPP